MLRTGKGWRAVTSPRDAEITIVGGGAIGAAVAYFLAREGSRDIQLLERARPVRGDQQPGGGDGRAGPADGRPRPADDGGDRDLPHFERDTGYIMDYRECGAVRLALSEPSVAGAHGRSPRPPTVTGLPVEFLTDARLREHLPGAGAYRDGQGRPVVADRRLPAAEQPGDRVRPARPGTSGSRWPRNAPVTGIEVARRRGAIGLDRGRHVPHRAGDHRGGPVVGGAGPAGRPRAADRPGAARVLRHRAGARLARRPALPAHPRGAGVRARGERPGAVRRVREHAAPASTRAR